MRGDADCNGAFELADAVLLARAKVGLESISTLGKQNVDLDNDGVLTDADLSRVLKALAGIAKL